MNKLKASGVIAYTVLAMTTGDKLGINNNLIIPSRDKIFQTTPAQGHARISEVGIETLVNEEGRREVYLKFEHGNEVQNTVIQNNGYAEPKLDERIHNYIERRREGLNQSTAYNKIEEWWDKLSLTVNYYAIRARETFDNLF